jgi:MFS family permease
VPNSVALAQELSHGPWQLRFSAVVLLGLPGGSALPAPVAAWLLPVTGWPSMFVLGAMVTTLVVLAMLRWLPESTAYLASRRAAGTSAAAPAAGSGWAALFRGPLAFTTPCLWLMMAGSMMALHVLTSWLPLLLADVGVLPADAAGMTGAVHLGGTLATLASIGLLGRFGLGWVALLFGCGAAGILLAALGDFSTTLLWPAVLLAGFGIVGSQGALGTLAAQRYPSSCRPTGVGLAIAVGRLGAVVGPLLGGAMHAAGFSTRGLFSLSLWPISVGLACTGLLALVESARRQAP